MPRLHRHALDSAGRALIVLVLLNAAPVHATEPPAGAAADSRAAVASPGDAAAPGSTSIRQAYTDVAVALGLHAVFDPELPEARVRFDPSELTPEEALLQLSIISGCFVVAIEEGTVLVAQDTPQKRRELEPVVLRTIVPDSLELREADRTLRSLMEARRLVANENLGTLTIRDTIAKADHAAYLIGLLDAPRSEVDVAYHVLEATTDALATATTTSGPRLSERELADLLGASHTRVLSHGYASLFSGDDVAVHSALRNTTIDLAIIGRVHPVTRDVSLTLTADLSRPASDLEPGTGHHVELEARLAPGQSYLVYGTEWVTGSDGVERQLVVALTPRIVRTVEIDEGRLERAIGTETCTTDPSPGSMWVPTG